MAVRQQTATLIFMDHIGRLRQVQAAVEKHRINVFLVSHPPNLRYLCGFTGSAGVLLITPRDRLLITDGRYSQQAKQEVKGVEIAITKKSALVSAGEWLAKRKMLRRIGIEPAHMTVAERELVAKAVAQSATWVAAPPLLEQMRMIKDAEEIAFIRKACLLGVELFAKVVEKCRPGISEAQVAGELEFAARKAGVDQMAFPTIIAGGDRSALPHGRASSAAIPAAGFVVCDFGVILAGYCSDMTRTVHVGLLQGKERSGYEAVREAQQKALDRVKPGVSVSEVDKAARKLLYNQKLGKYFTHSTGHGLGLEIHEAPRLAAKQTELLQPGMVVTIEPGVYLPGQWGVRIEDTVVVTETGCEILTSCPKDLLTL
jgi:Xaa-Pro aminopeptidase